MKKESNPSTKIDLKDWKLLSSMLTGEQVLSDALLSQYLDRIQSATLGDRLGDLLNAFASIRSAGGDVRSAIGTQILADPQLGPLSRQITILWFTGQLVDQTGKSIPAQTPEQYFGALVWHAARAHAPGSSGGYFGHWTYPPEN